MNGELKACPFCGDFGAEVAISEILTIHGKKHAVYCNTCFTEGPPAIGEPAAVTAWNTRPTPAPGALPELPDMHEANKALCSFTQRWRVDGDYIRCGTCDRPQLTSFADKPFPHADFCRVKDSPSMECTPWLTYAELLAPLSRAYAEQCRAGVWLPIESAQKDGSSILVTGGEWFSDDGEYEFTMKHVVIATWLRDKWFIGAGYAHDVNHWAEPTHWMPLPAPPSLQSSFADDEGVKRG